MRNLTFFALLHIVSASLYAGTRARDLGIPFSGVTGKWNAITDVAGVEVGHVTLIEGEGPLIVEKGPIRTGVTAILPKGRVPSEVPAGWFSLNGNGELTGTAWIEENGVLDGPVIFTNTYSVGVARDAVRSWARKTFKADKPDGEDPASLPVVGETWDGRLNDINGMHVKKEHVFAALNQTSSGPVAEGNVGGGTGMVAFNYKSGIGTSSRVVSINKRKYTLGTLVQSNFGDRNELRIGGIHVGLRFKDPLPVIKSEPQKEGSILVLIATDAPLLPHQLKRLARRVSLGIGRVGGYSKDSSGELFLAFSTRSPIKRKDKLQVHEVLANEDLNELFKATVESTEESIVNALVAAETMIGMNGNKIDAISKDKLRELFQKKK